MPSPTKSVHRARVIARAGDRCEYCLIPVLFTGIGLHVDHVVPASRGGSDDIDNLCAACANCNLRKAARIEGIDPLTGALVGLFSPRADAWHAHLAWSQAATEITGLTPIGRATVHALQLNHPDQVIARRRWVAAGWWPPSR